MRTLLSLLLPASLGAQIVSDASSSIADRLSFSIAGKWVEPIGGFAKNVGWGVGGGISLGYHLRFFEALGLRTELSHHWYGWENKRVQLSPTANRVFINQSTTNNIFVWSFGPELAIRRGPLRPYAYWQAGFSNFYTASSAKDETTGDTFAESTHLHDYGFASEYGGGLRFAMKSAPGKGRISIDVGALVTNNGTRHYLRSGDITDNPDGSLSFNVRKSRANFLQYRLGFLVSEL